MADDFFSTLVDALSTGQNTQAPTQPPLAPAPQPQSDLDQKIADAKAVQAAPNVQPQMSEPTSFSGPLPIPADLAQGINPAQQAQIQQQRQQSEGEKEAASSSRPRPILADLLSGIVGKNLGGPSTPGYQGPSRTQHFENFLVNFLESLSQGLSQEGRGPGAMMRGMGAAIGAPEQQAINRAQVGQQFAAGQAQIADTQSQTALRQAQARQLSEMVTMPNGQTMPIGLAMKVYPAYFSAEGRVKAAEISADARKQGDILKAQIASGAVTLKDAVDPKTGELGKGKYDKQGNFLGMADNAVAAAALFPHTTSTQDFIPTDQGVVQVNKTTTSAPNVQKPSNAVSNLPASIQNKITGSGAPQRPVQKDMSQQSTPLPAQIQAARNRAAGGGNAKFLTGPDGQPLMKNGGDNGYAYDQDGHLVYTTRAEAVKGGLTEFEKASPADVKSDKSALRMLNDVQINKSRYAQAAADYFKNGGDYDNDKWLVAKIISENPFSVSGGVFDIHMPAADMLNKIENSKAYTDLSPAGKELVDGYYRAKAAVPAYQKALTNIGRSNKEMMDLELNNIPDPILSMGDIQRKLAAFQENIDRATEGFPRFRDIKSTTDIRKQFEPSWNGGDTRKTKFTLNPDDMKQFLSTFSKGKQQ